MSDLKCIRCGVAIKHGGVWASIHYPEEGPTLCEPCHIEELEDAPAARLARIEARFEKLLCRILSGCPLLKGELEQIWKVAEEAEEFLEKKRKPL